MIRGYYLGCPAWGIKEWAGSLYLKRARPADYLSQYAEVFNAVEGNTTFYSLPSPETVTRWQEATPESFRFCFKFPRPISHWQGLASTDDKVRVFLERLAPLGERLGPFMLQLPPGFGPDRGQLLERFLRALPEDFRYAVELRHPGFFADHDAVRRTDALLERAGCERVIMDTRALRSGDAEHPAVAGARHRKPDLPIQATALGKNPLVRFIGHPDEAVNRPWLERWSADLKRWIAEGREPYFFAHCPDNTPMPRFARELHALLSHSADVGEMPSWPGEGGQLSLL